MPDCCCAALFREGDTVTQTDLNSVSEIPRTPLNFQRKLRPQDSFVEHTLCTIYATQADVRIELRAEGNARTTFAIQHGKSELDPVDQSRDWPTRIICGSRL
jgi:hypothetical protein